MPAIPVEGTAKVIIGGVTMANRTPAAFGLPDTLWGFPVVICDIPEIRKASPRSMKEIAAKAMTRGLRMRPGTVRGR